LRNHGQFTLRNKCLGVTVSKETLVQIIGSKRSPFSIQPNTTFDHSASRHRTTLWNVIH